ncbi:hypothetical protein ACFQ60_17800 [Streptomyces zhihengii]|uniref:Transposase n=1 Tax=Streptomyces zhihengii TaxID=1818004 RepID=A0ABS2UWI6_9ACTN|nr:hypothetical protein [Streptomyces zhihengii]MBM9621803.1 hypothetical protein [Streptomyces zhihengii]
MKLTAPQHRLHCPACRTIRPVREVGNTRIGNRWHTLVQCVDKACELIWAIRGLATTRDRAA